MRKRILYIFATFTVPLFLFFNVWQSQKYMVEYFEVKTLTRTQEDLIVGNKGLLNRVAELEAPVKVVGLVDSIMDLHPIGKDGIVRLRIEDGIK